MSGTLLSRHPASERPPVATVRSNVLESLDRIDSYPMFSETTVRAMAMVNNPNIASSEVAGLIYRDSVLAASVLRLANNWMYRGKKEINDVQQAVLRIGMKECAKLLCTMGLRKISTNLAPAVQKRCDELLRHCLFVAQIAAAITRTIHRDYGGAEFTAGLLHDIGRLIACVKAPAESAIADPIDFDEDEDTLQRERQYLGIDHCAIGYNFATKNRLPESLVRVILNHHRPADENLQQELVALVALADRLGNFAQREHKISGYDVSTCPFFFVLVHCWPDSQQVALRRSIPMIIVQAIRETKQMLKAFA